MAIILLLLSKNISAQIVNLEPDQTLNEYINDKFSTSPYRFDSLRSFLLNGQNIHVATVYHYNPEHDDNLLVFIYRRIKNDRYQQIFVDSQGVNGGLAELVTVFTANADTDRQNEVVVLYRWRVKSYDFEGYIYDVYCYDDDASLQHTSLKPIESSPKFNCGFEGWRYGKTEHAKYNTEAKIRRRLKQLGYRQYEK